MENFSFYNPTRIIFGKAAEKNVGKEVAAYSKNILLCYGGGSIKKSGLYDSVVTSLKENHIEFTELSGIKPNPVLSMVHAGIKICKEKNIDFILAVGGGSVIDTAKAIAVGSKYDGEVWDFFERKAEIKAALKVAVVLTIPAAGSESSNSAVITKEEGLLKRGFGSPLIYPVFSTLNPELTYTLPAYQTACGVADMMAHVMERYFTNTKSIDLSDRLCESTLKTVINYAPIAIKDPSNYDARAQIMWSGTIAHNNLIGIDRIGDWSSHAIEHELSALYDIPHGAGLSIVFPAWMKYVYKHNRDRFLQFAVRVWDVDLSLDSPDAVVNEAIRRITEFFKSIGLPTTLKEASIGEEKLEEMASKCTGNNSYTVGNFLKLSKEDIYNIYRLAL